MECAPIDRNMAIFKMGDTSCMKALLRLQTMEQTSLIGDVLCFAYGITLSNIRFVSGNVELRQQHFPCIDTSFQMNVFILIIHYVVMDSIRNQSTH